MSRLQRLLAWIYDPSGARRMELQARRERAAEKMKRLHDAEQRAVDQIRETQAFVRTQRGDFD